MAGGRTPKLTKDLITRLSNLFVQGASDKDACALVGITQASYYMWLSMAEWHETDGKTGTEPYKNISKKIFLEFLESVRRSKAQSLVLSVNEIRRAGSPQWRHRTTGKIMYREPAPVTYMNKYTGELIFERPADIGNWVRELSGEAWMYIPGKWQSLAWYVERSDPDNWGRKDELHADFEPVELIITRRQYETDKD